MMSRLNFRWTMLTIAALFALVACSDDSPAGPGGPVNGVAEVRVTPEQTTLEPGTELPLFALLVSSTGEPLPSKPVTWQSSDTTVVKVAANGMVKAVGTGVAEVSATVDGKRGTSRIEVKLPGAPEAKKLSPASAEMTLAAIQLTIEGSGFVQGMRVTWRGQERPATFVSATELRVQLAAGDLGVAGPVQVVVHEPGVNGRSTAPLWFEVKAAPAVRWIVIEPREVAVWENGEIQLRAKLYGDDGRELPSRPVTWTIANPEVAWVDGTGKLTGLKAGSTQVRAGIGAIAMWANVEVRRRPTGNQWEYGLRPMDGEIMPTVGDTIWTDENGVEHEAILGLWDSRLVIDFSAGPSYTQTFTLQIYARAGSGYRPVGQVTRTDRGRVFYVFGEQRLDFKSDVMAGREFTATEVGPGDLRVRQTIGTAPLHTYRMIVR